MWKHLEQRLTHGESISCYCYEIIIMPSGGKNNGLGSDNTLSKKKKKYRHLSLSLLKVSFLLVPLPLSMRWLCSMQTTRNLGPLYVIVHILGHLLGIFWVQWSSASSWQIRKEVCLLRSSQSPELLPHSHISQASLLLPHPADFISHLVLLPQFLGQNTAHGPTYLQSRLRNAV